MLKRAIKPLSRTLLHAVFACAFVTITLCIVARASSGAAGNGDVNGDGAINLADAVYLLAFVFEGGPPPVAIAGTCFSPATFDSGWVPVPEGGTLVIDHNVGGDPAKYLIDLKMTAPAYGINGSHLGGTWGGGPPAGGGVSYAGLTDTSVSIYRQEYTAQAENGIRVLIWRTD